MHVLEKSMLWRTIPFRGNTILSKCCLYIDKKIVKICEGTNLIVFVSLQVVWTAYEASELGPKVFQVKWYKSGGQKLGSDFLNEKFESNLWLKELYLMSMENFNPKESNGEYRATARNINKKFVVTLTFQMALHLEIAPLTIHFRRSPWWCILSFSVL